MIAGPDTAGEERAHAFRLQSQGRLAEALAAYRRLVKRDPDDFESWNNLGNVHRAGGQFKAAVDALDRAVRLRPELPMLRLNLAGALAEAGRPADGLAALNEAARLAPDDLACLFELSRAHARSGDHDAALAPLDHAAAVHPDRPEIHVERGLVQAARGDYAAAETAYRTALGVQPAFLPAFLFLGILLEHTNRAEGLHPLLEEAQANGIAYRDLALLRAFALRRDGDFPAALEAARAASANFEPVRRAQLIGEMADRLGDTSLAFQAFSEMNRIAASALPAPDRVAAVYRDEVETLLGLTAAGDPSGRIGPDAARPSPIFLMGFPRSGTTFLDTILMGHSGLHVAEEQPLLQPVLARIGDARRLAELRPDELFALRDLYFETVDALAPAPAGKRLIDKMPLNIPRLPVIHRLFPDAPIIFSLRHPCDVVLSCFMTNFSLNYAMANFLELESAARLYDLVMRSWVRSREIFPLSVHEVRYEALVEDLEGSARDLLVWLGLGWEEGIEEHRRAALARGYVRSASYSQVTEPVYDRARGRWTRYREQMRPVLPTLEPWARRFGYDL